MCTLVHSSGNPDLRLQLGHLIKPIEKTASTTCTSSSRSSDILHAPIASVHPGICVTADTNTCAWSLP